MLAFNKLGVKPVRRGLFCDDPSISYPYQPDTVRASAVIIGYILVPSIAVRVPTFSIWWGYAIHTNLFVLVEDCFTIIDIYLDFDLATVVKQVRYMSVWVWTPSKALVVPLRKKLYTHYSVLVSSRNGFKCNRKAAVWISSHSESGFGPFYFWYQFTLHFLSSDFSDWGRPRVFWPKRTHIYKTSAP